MVEYIREVKITVYVDTNKSTYQKTFNSIEEAVEYLNDIEEKVENGF